MNSSAKPRIVDEVSPHSAWQSIKKEVATLLKLLSS